jgi:uncharacterized membrane protein
MLAGIIKFLRHCIKYLNTPSVFISMKIGGRVIGVVVIIITALLIVASISYSRHLEQQRTQAIAQLVSTPDYANCKYDAATCPQAQGNVVLPDATGIGLVLFGILLGLYLIRSDSTQRKILAELETKRSQLSKDEKKELLFSVLTVDERKIIAAVIEQPGISQATLRLRTDMSKAKLSMLLKALEERELIVKTEDGKTNTVHLKREL